MSGVGYLCEYLDIWCNDNVQYGISVDVNFCVLESILENFKRKAKYIQYFNMIFTYLINRFVF